MGITLFLRGLEEIKARPLYKRAPNSLFFRSDLTKHTRASSCQSVFWLIFWTWNNLSSSILLGLENKQVNRLFSNTKNLFTELISSEQ